MRRKRASKEDKENREDREFKDLRKREGKRERGKETFGSEREKRKKPSGARENFLLEWCGSGASQKKSPKG